MNAQMIVAIVIIAIAAVLGIVWFIKLPNGTKIKNVKEWLKWAVVEAERQLGSGTGQLKLRLVYDMAVKQFTWIGQIITFDSFSAWVDEALDWMREQLSDNAAAQSYVTGSIEEK